MDMIRKEHYLNIRGKQEKHNHPKKGNNSIVHVMMREDEHNRVSETSARCGNIGEKKKMGQTCGGRLCQNRYDNYGQRYDNCGPEKGQCNTQGSMEEECEQVHQRLQMMGQPMGKEKEENVWIWKIINCFETEK